MDKTTGMNVTAASTRRLQLPCSNSGVNRMANSKDRRSNMSGRDWSFACMRKPQQRAFYRVLSKKSPYHSNRVAESYCNQSIVFRRNVAAANGDGQSEWKIIAAIAKVLASNALGGRPVKAAVVPAMSSSWQIQDVPQPQPGPNQVLVKMHASGICYIDVQRTLGHLPGQFPRILGHEPVGEIVAVAPDVTTRKPGDRVGQGKVKSIVETYPLAEAAKAYDRVAEGKTHFRAVLTM
jgi:hypothetical protein